MPDDRENKPANPPGGASASGFPLLQLDGPGPFELPGCSGNVSVLTEDHQFLLRLEVAGSEQAVFVPLPWEAAEMLEAVARFLVENRPHGAPETKH